MLLHGSILVETDIVNRLYTLFVCCELWVIKT